MKGILQIILVGYFGLVLVNSIENQVESIQPNGEHKIKESTPDSEGSTKKAESDQERDSDNNVATLETSITAPKLFPPPVPEDINKKQRNSTQGLPNQIIHPYNEINENYNTEQERLIHSDSEEDPLSKGNQPFSSATSTASFKRSFSANESSSSNAIESAGTGYYDNTLDNGNEQEYHPQINHGIDTPVHGNIPHSDYHHKGRPLKPSIVHRDPHDGYDHHDKIRTLDKDGLHHNKHKAEYNYHQQHHYHYNGQRIPDCAQKNIYFYNLTFCLEDHQYPSDAVLWAIKDAGVHAYHLLNDVTYQSADNLVDGLTRAEEEGYTYQHYFGSPHHQHTHLDQYKPPFSGYSYSENYYKKGGYICPSDIYYGRPRRAMNTYGKWKIIVNLDYVGQQPHHSVLHNQDHTGYPKLLRKAYTQTLRLEQCIYPNAPCSYIDSHYHSRCIQKHNFIRLVAWNYHQGLHIDTFKMPIACSCHVSQPTHFHQQQSPHNTHQVQGHASEAVTVETPPSKNVK